MKPQVHSMVSELTYDNLSFHYLYQISIFTIYRLFSGFNVETLTKPTVEALQAHLKAIEYEIKSKMGQKVKIIYDESVWHPASSYGKSCILDIDNGDTSSTHIVFELDLRKDALTGVSIISSNKPKTLVNAFSVEFIMPQTLYDAGIVKS